MLCHGSRRRYTRVVSASDRSPFSAEELNNFLGPERDVEGMLLRGHLLIERELLALLRDRLAIGADELPPRISFELLAKLALSGATYSHELSLVLTVNTVRNRLAHRISYEASDATQDLQSVVAVAREHVPFTTSTHDAASQVRGTIAFVIGRVLDAHIRFLESRHEIVNTLVRLREQLLLAKIQAAVDLSPGCGTTREEREGGNG